MGAPYAEHVWTEHSIQTGRLSSLELQNLLQTIDAHCLIMDTNQAWFRDQILAPFGSTDNSIQCSSGQCQLVTPNSTGLLLKAPDFHFHKSTFSLSRSFIQQLSLCLGRYFSLLWHSGGKRKKPLKTTAQTHTCPARIGCTGAVLSQGLRYSVRIQRNSDPLSSGQFHLLNST